MSEDGDNSWNHTHRAFLQCLLSRQVITFAEAQPILAQIQTIDTPDRPTLTGDITQEDFENYVYAISNNISRFDLEIRNTLHQKSNSRVYALVNTTSDALTQMATVYTPDEISFIRRVLEAMFDTYNTREAEVMAVTGMQAARLSKVPRENRRDSGNDTQSGPVATSLSVGDAEAVMDNLEAQGWLERSRAGYYSLAPRALMELKDWLVRTFNRDEEEEEVEDEERDDYVRIKMCRGCQDVVTVGQRCPNLDCLVRVHGFCARNFFRAHGNQVICPECKTDWQNPPPVGEGAANGGGRSRPITSGTSSTSRSRDRRSSRRDDSDAMSGAEAND